MEPLGTLNQKAQTAERKTLKPTPEVGSSGNLDAFWGPNIVRHPFTVRALKERPKCQLCEEARHAKSLRQSGERRVDVHLERKSWVLGLAERL